MKKEREDQLIDLIPKILVDWIGVLVIAMVFGVGIGILAITASAMV